MRLVLAMQLLFIYVFYGLALILYSDFLFFFPILLCTLVAVFLAFCPWVSPEAESMLFFSGHNGESNARHINRLIILYSVAYLGFYLVKYYVYGVPVLSEDLAYVRVDFARHLSGVTDILRFSSFILIAIIVYYRRSFGLLLLVLLIVTTCNFLSGFRSTIVDPYIVVLLAYILRGGGIRFKVGAAVFGLAGSVFLLVLYSTMVRLNLTVNDAGVVLESVFRRLFYVNFLNIERVMSIYQSSLLGVSYWWDLQSLFGMGLGFNGTTTQLTGFDNFERFTMTPTVYGETFANFGLTGVYALYLALPCCLCLLVSVFKNVPNRRFILKAMALVFVFSFLRYLQPHGFGSLLFSHTVKLVIASFIFFLVYRAVKLTGGVARRRHPII